MTRFLPAPLFSGRLLRGLALLLVLGLLATRAMAQDVIIKNNKEEIKAKVLEIEETTVKYKLFDFQDGPSYTIRKSEVFMILYHGGRRETFDAAPAPAPAPAAPTRIAAAQAERDAIAQTTRSAAPAKATSGSTDDRVNRDLLRIMAGTASAGFTGEDSGADGSGFTLDVAAERRLIANYVNYGVSALYTSYTIDSYAGSSSAGAVASADITTIGASIFASGYLPLNRIMGKRDKQDQGLFPYVQVGFGYYSTDFKYDSNSTGSGGGSASYNFDGSSSGFGSYYAAGLDYKFSPKFGVTVQTWSFSGVGAGINFRI